MPLIVTTTTVDAPPDRVVSSDGTLSATADTEHGGVLLRADFSGGWGASDTFEYDTNGWSGVTAASVSRGTSNPIDGSASLLWDRTATTSVVARTLPPLPAQPYEQKIVVYFTTRTTTAASLDVTVGWGETKPAGTSTATPQPLFATFYVPAGTVPPTQVTFTSTGSAGTDIVLDDVNIQVQPPTAVYMFRDGVPVRGAAPSLAASGVAYGYDYQSTFGQAATWTAQPVYTIRDAEVIAPPGAGVALVVPDLPTDYNMSLKSLTQPNLSRRVIGKWPAATRAWEGRDSMSANPGASLSSGSWDVPVAQAETWVMETTTREEAAALERLLLSGPLLVQHAQNHHRTDMHAIVKTISCDFKRGPVWPELLWSVSFLPIEEPTSTGAPLLIPGRSYADLSSTFGTYANFTSGNQSYDTYLTPATVLVGTGFGVQPFGTTPFGT